MNLFKFLKQYKLTTVPLQYQERDSNRTVYSNSSIVSHIWLGISYYTYNGYFMWDEESGQLNYENWDDDSPDRSATNLCVQVNMETGKWSDIKCTKKNLVLCQKSNELTLTNLYSALQNVYSDMNHRVNEQNKIDEFRTEIEQIKR